MTGCGEWGGGDDDDRGAASDGAIETVALPPNLGWRGLCMGLPWPSLFGNHVRFVTLRFVTLG